MEMNLVKVRNWAEINKPDGWEVIWMTGIRDGFGYQQYVRIDGPGVGVLVRPDEICVGFLGNATQNESSPDYKAAQELAIRLKAVESVLSKDDA